MMFFFFGGGGVSHWLKEHLHFTILVFKEARGSMLRTTYGMPRKTNVFSETMQNKWALTNKYFVYKYTFIVHLYLRHQKEKEN